MAVYIKNMDVPESCDKCWALGIGCELWHMVYSGQRHLNCPVSEQKQGQWIEYRAEHGQCPFCGHRVDLMTPENCNYCSNCGAKLDIYHPNEIAIDCPLVDDKKAISYTDCSNARNMLTKWQWKQALDELFEIPIINGNYDAVNGSSDFMDGIQYVIEVMANNAEDDKVHDAFLNNRILSEEIPD